MAIIITKLIETLLEDGTQIDSEKTIYVHPEFCIIKEQFCPDPDDDTFVTIGLGGGTEITKAQLKTRALDIHTRYPFQTLVFGNPLTHQTHQQSQRRQPQKLKQWLTIGVRRKTFHE